MFYNLILNMWIMATITAEQVQSKAPKYISQLQVEMFYNKDLPLKQKK